MGRLGTGSVISHETRRGRVFALRFRAYGKRRFLTLGTEAEGWTVDKAYLRLDEVLAEVQAGTFEVPQTLDDIIRGVLAESDLADPKDVAALVLEKASEDTIWAEVELMVAGRVRELVRARRKPHKAGGAAPEDILDWRVAVAQGWKKFGQCDAKDLRDVIEMRKDEARALLEDIAALGHVRDALVETGAATVADLGSEGAQAAWDGKWKSHSRRAEREAQLRAAA